MADRITEIRVEGMRTIESLQLPLKGLTVLIGENATGKSTIVEALEILRRAPTTEFVSDIHKVHGGPNSLLRVDTNALTLEVTVDGDDGPLGYSITLEGQHGYAIVTREQVFRRHSTPGGPDIELVPWHRGGVEIYPPAVPQRAGQPTPDRKPLYVAPDRTALSVVGAGNAWPDAARITRALESIEVHVPIDAPPAWAARAINRGGSMRSSTPIEPTTRLATTAYNLANAYQALKNDFSDDHWRETMAWVRLGLGDDLESVNTRPDGSGGSIWLSVRYRGLDRQIPSATLSDGTLAYLALVASMRLSRNRSLLALDEPELHLHPHLLGRVVQLLEDRVAEKHPVIIATHSDRLLDALKSPAESVVVCELDEQRRTVLSRLDADQFARWREGYSGFGALRAAGYGHLVMEPAPEPEP